MRKAKIVLSDLHLGAGYVELGNALEDFTDDEVFSGFLVMLASESQSHGYELELILAGDTFEFLQVPPVPQPQAYDPRGHYPSAQYASSTREDARRKMALIVAGHPLVFGALRTFLQSSAPRRTATVVKGNHDVCLHWESVQNEIRQAVGALGDRSELLQFEERAVSREGIHVEHGNQYAERINRFPDLEEPHDPDDPEQLYLPTGSRLVTDLLTGLERDRYWIDGVKPFSALIWYLFVLDLPTALRALTALLALTPGIIWGSRSELQGALLRMAGGQALGNEVQDLADTRSLAPGSPEYRALMVRVEHALSPYSGLRRVRADRAQIPDRSPALARAMAEEVMQHASLVEAAAARANQEDARVVVFGHTHHTCSEPLPSGAVYLNAGTWTWQRNFEGADLDTWKRLIRNGERFASDRRLTYVWIDYDDAGEPHAKLMEIPRDEEPRPSLWLRILDWLAGDR